MVNTLVRSRDGDFGLSLIMNKVDESFGQLAEKSNNIDNVEDLILSPKITDDGWTPLLNPLRALSLSNWWSGLFSELLRHRRASREGFVQQPIRPPWRIVTKTFTSSI